MSVRTERAWAAGFFDGEGTIFLRRTARHKGGTTGKYYPLTTVEMAVAQVRPEPLRRFRKVIGFGKFGGPYNHKQKNHRPYYRWLTAGRPHCHEALSILWPYMSEPKKQQARKVWKLLKRLKTKRSPALKELPR